MVEATWCHSTMARSTGVRAMLTRRFESDLAERSSSLAYRDALSVRRAFFHNGCPSRHRGIQRQRRILVATNNEQQPETILHLSKEGADLGEFHGGLEDFLKFAMAQGIESTLRECMSRVK